MSRFAHSAGKLAAAAGLFHGRTLAYRVKDDAGATSATLEVCGASVRYIDSDGYEDDQGRVWARAIDVAIPIESLDTSELTVTPVLDDALYFDDVEWTIARIHQMAGSWRFVAARDQIRNLHAASYRRNRRTPNA